MTTPNESDSLRRSLYYLLIVLATGMALGRICSAELLLEPSYHRDANNPEDRRRKWPLERPRPMPTFSSNDRSRWCTVRALVDEGTFVIGRRDPARISPTSKYGDHGITFEDGWGTVDKIMNPETGEFYSTKPPLLPILMAGHYWILKHTLGWTLTEQPFAVVRTTLITFNLVPWIVYLLVLMTLVERFGRTDWGRIYVFTVGCFGSLMTPFLISMNNHTLGTCSAMLAIFFALRFWHTPRAIEGALTGLFAAITVTNELPALAFAVGLALLLLLRAPRPTMLGFAPAALLVAGVLLFTNWLPTGEIVPAYSKFGGPWYTYEGSHWRVEPGQVKYGIDWARNQETRLTYAFHVILGHHGILSLTPFVLLALVGMLWALPRWRSPDATTPDDRLLWRLAGCSLLLTVVVVGFYLIKSDNYGGWTNGPRWVMWLSPFWLLSMIPVADALSRARAGRGLASVLLLLSVLAVHYQSWNPWRHPWIYNFLDSRGMIPY